MRIGSKVIKLMIWDTAGQEQFRSITKLFYKDSAAAVIVYDITRESSFQNVKDWQNEIQNNAGDDILPYLVGNRADIEE